MKVSLKIAAALFGAADAIYLGSGMEISADDMNNIDFDQCSEQDWAACAHDPKCSLTNQEDDYSGYLPAGEQPPGSPPKFFSDCRGLFGCLCKKPCMQQMMNTTAGDEYACMFKAGTMKVLVETAQCKREAALECVEESVQSGEYCDFAQPLAPPEGQEVSCKAMITCTCKKPCINMIAAFYGGKYDKNSHGDMDSDTIVPAVGEECVQIMTDARKALLKHTNATGSAALLDASTKMTSSSSGANQIQAEVQSMLAA